MNQIDVFNGDADGICALHQFRLVYPSKSQLVSGVKRDIKLLEKVQATSSTEINVFDISLDSNRSEVERLLGQGAKVRYFDHHFSGQVPKSLHFTAHIEESVNFCTSLIVNRYLSGMFRSWALVGAYGDGIHEVADKIGIEIGLTKSSLENLRKLGQYLNYNAYGETLSDLYISPIDLYLRLSPYKSPIDFIQEDLLFLKLGENYLSDIQKAFAIKAEFENQYVAIYILPDQAWARRVGGAFANEVMQNKPERALAILTQSGDHCFVVSVRSPISSQISARDLCSQFPTGGGRKAAAGINRLDEKLYESFVERFKIHYDENEK